MNRSVGLLLAGVSLMASVGWGAQVVGSVAQIQGKVAILGADESARDPAVGDAVYEHDRLLTKSASKVRVRFVDGTTLDQGENGDMRIDRYAFDASKAAATESHMTLTRGTFRVNTGQITKVNPEGFRVQTRMATIGIRGSDICFVVPRWGPVQVFTVALSGPHDLVIVTRELVNGAYVEKMLTISVPNLQISIGADGKITQVTASVATLIAIIRFAMPDSEPVPEDLVDRSEQEQQNPSGENSPPQDLTQVMIEVPVVAQFYEGQ